MARVDLPGPYSLDTLAALPVPSLFTTDPDVLRARYIAWFEGAAGRTLYPAQVEMLLIDMLAYAMSLVGEEGQAVAEQHLVAFAGEDGLERLGFNRSTPRLGPSAAQTTLRFATNAILPANLAIPAGTRVAAPGGVIFATTASDIIAAGDVFTDVPALAAEAGTAGNGYGIGTITVLMDPIPGVQVGNITVSEGGSGEEDLEAYRLRVANAFARISKAGPGKGYRETVMGFSPALVDVAVVRPQPCYIEIYPLTADGPAGPELRDFILQGLDPETVRPQGDEVSVLPPQAVAIEATFTIVARGDLAAIEARARAVVARRTDAWSLSLASVIAPSELVAYVKALEGVIDCGVEGFEWSRLAPHQFATFSIAAVIMIDGDAP